MTHDEIRALLREVQPISGTSRQWPGCKVFLRDRVEQQGGSLAEVDVFVEQEGGLTHERYPVGQPLSPHAGQRPVPVRYVYVVPDGALDGDGIA